MGTMTISGRRVENLPTLGAINTVPVSDGAGGLTMAVTSNVRVTHTIAQSVGDGATISVAFDTERFDTDTMHDTVTNNSRITIQTAGKYILWASIRWQTNVLGTRLLILRRNGATEESRVQGPPALGSAVAEQPLVAIVDAALNDFFEIRAFQNSGGALNVEVNPGTAPEFGAIRILG